MFMGNIIKSISDNLSKEIHRQIVSLEKKTAGALLIVVGCIFFIIAMALFINTLTIPWLGYLIVGVVVTIVGYALAKK